MNEYTPNKGEIEIQLNSIIDLNKINELIFIKQKFRT
jgi:hypothetical protein